jgi:hypothetical protein
MNHDMPEGRQQQIAEACAFCGWFLWSFLWKRKWLVAIRVVCATPNSVHELSPLLLRAGFYGLFMVAYVGTFAQHLQTQIISNHPTPLTIRVESNEASPIPDR